MSGPVRSQQVTTVNVAPGEHYVTNRPDVVITTILGSCIAACIRDPQAGVGGMNHFMLPSSESGDWGGTTGSLRYGNFAMERLVNQILIRGGRRQDLEIKVFGGGNVLGGTSSVGHANADFIEWYLRSEGMALAAAQLRGEIARQVKYFPISGKVMVKSVTMHNLKAEAAYRKSLVQAPVESDIELFD